ncbi:tRNA 2-thiouridine(34) synthase MnmA [Candidatus Dependentiae bacterium]|nr:tRNA 2-thiouridine(34) synthase MnmA [Candidatus Dependentiae bacterium]
MERKKIAVLVSGGVDSSVALALLKEQGHELVAFYLKIWLEDELSYLGTCPWQQDLAFVQGVCLKLDVPLQIISMQQKYHDVVVSYLLQEVQQGRTPNPDILCNQQIKFGAFYDCIDASFDYVATGHYAQVEHTASGSVLKKGKDPVKDQSYFLALLSQQQLKRALFPIGSYEKKQVRALAQKYNLPTKDRKDSQGICFLGKFSFADFLKAHLGIVPGPIVEFESGMQLGVHQGFWLFTIGQRQGLGLSGGPWYVVKKDAVNNIVFVSRSYEQVGEHKRGMLVKDFNFLSLKQDKKIFFLQPRELDVRFRHGPAVFKSQVFLEDECIKIVLKQPSKQGIAAGQFAVLYDGDVCLGGGQIDAAF